jgi:hypothetical protein
VVGGHSADVAEHPVRHQGSDDGGLGLVPTPHRLHEQHAGAPGRFDEDPRLGGGGRQGLLDEDVLSCRDGEESQREVLALGRRDVDDVDIRLAHELVVGTVGPRDAVLGGERLGALSRSGRDRHEALVGVPVHRRHEGACNEAGCEQAPPERGLTGSGGEEIGLGESSRQHRGELLR